MPSLAGLHAAADGLDAGEDLAHVHGLAHHVVDAGGEQVERLLQRLVVVHGDDGGVRPALDQLGKYMAVAAVPKKKSLDRQNIGLRDGLDPVVEIGGAEARCGYTLAVEPGAVSLCNGLTLIYNNDHPISPKSQRSSCRESSTRSSSPRQRLAVRINSCEVLSVTTKHSCLLIRGLVFAGPVNNW